MIKLAHPRFSLNEEKQYINVSFKIHMELYESIKDVALVEDLGLAVLAGCERTINKARGEVDSPEQPPVDTPEQ